MRPISGLCSAPVIAAQKALHHQDDAVHVARSDCNPANFAVQNVKARSYPHIAACHVTCSVPFLVQGILKGGLCEALDGLLSVVHAHAHAWPIKLLHFPLLHLTATVGREHQLQLAGLLHHQVCCSVLVPKSMPATMIVSKRSTTWSGVEERSMEWSRAHLWLMLVPKSMATIMAKSM